MVNKLKTLYRRLILVEDPEVPLRDYEIETLYQIRLASRKLSWVSTSKLCNLYHEWSTRFYFAGWMDISGNSKWLQRFILWATTAPMNAKEYNTVYRNKLS